MDNDVALRDRSYWNLGTLEGRLEAINLHGENPTFTVWDRVTLSPVRCSFPKDHAWTERVKGLLEKRVRVMGKIAYYLNGVPRSISEIKTLEDATPSADLPEPTFGCIPDSDASADPVGFLRQREKK